MWCVTAGLLCTGGWFCDVFSFFRGKGLLMETECDVIEENEMEPANTDNADNFFVF